MQKHAVVSLFGLLMLTVSTLLSLAFLSALSVQAVSSCDSANIMPSHVHGSYNPFKQDPVLNRVLHHGMYMYMTILNELNS